MIKYTQLGKPVQNSCVERFNRFFSVDNLDTYIFNNIHHECELASEWMNDSNTNHP
ncbi:MAG: transposase [Bacteroidales bacterium]|nr:transposase [Bacteroidales bacterium]